jgi:hypothetical protein
VYIKNYVSFSKTAYFWAILFVTLKMVDVFSHCGLGPTEDSYLRIDYTVFYGLLRK